MARTRRRDPGLDAIGTRIAAAIAAELEAAGYPLDWQVYGRLLASDGPVVAELRRRETAHQVAVYEDRAARRAAWAQSAGALSSEDLQAHWGLSRAEMRAARDLGVLRPVEVPYDLREAFSTPAYFAAMPLGADDRARIAAATLLSRLDAAERLGITPAAFDRLRKAHGLEIADRAPTRTGHMMVMFRQTDVDALAQHLGVS